MVTQQTPRVTCSKEKENNYFRTVELLPIYLNFVINTHLINQTNNSVQIPNKPTVETDMPYLNRIISDYQYKFTEIR
jgi:hypothetical protein